MSTRQSHPEKQYTSDILHGIGYPFVPTGSLNQGIIVYTESDVIVLPNHQGISYWKVPFDCLSSLYLFCGEINLSCHCMCGSVC